MIYKFAAPIDSSYSLPYLTKSALVNFCMTATNGLLHTTPIKANRRSTVSKHESPLPTKYSQRAIVAKIHSQYSASDQSPYASNMPVQWNVVPRVYSLVLDGHLLMVQFSSFVTNIFASSQFDCKLGSDDVLHI